MYCIIKCIVQGKQARVKNADLRHPSCAAVMSKMQIYVTLPQCVKVHHPVVLKYAEREKDFSESQHNCLCVC